MWTRVMPSCARCLARAAASAAASAAAFAVGSTACSARAVAASSAAAHRSASARASVHSLAMVVAVVVLVGATVSILDAPVVARQHRRLTRCLDQLRRQLLACITRRPTRAALATLKPLAVQEVAILQEVVNVLLHHIVRACARLEAGAVESVEDVDVLLVHEAHLSGASTGQGRGS
eukprot:7388274-Prymnesium_polylepis.1